MLTARINNISGRKNQSFGFNKKIQPFKNEAADFWWNMRFNLMIRFILFMCHQNKICHINIINTDVNLLSVISIISIIFYNFYYFLLFCIFFSFLFFLSGLNESNIKTIISLCRLALHKLSWCWTDGTLNIKCKI